MADQPIRFNSPFPEVQVRSPYKLYTNKIIGSVYVTGGFMESKGHGYKSTSRKAIFSDGQLKTIRPGNYNIGFDYTSGYGSNVACMYSGQIVKAGREGGYGNRLHVKLDKPFVWQGKAYTCYQAYAHCLRLLKTVGEKVSQGEAIAIESGYGLYGPNDYGSHVDLDTYFYLKGEKIHINFELLAEGEDDHDYIEKIEIMKKGSRGYDVCWLQSKLNLVVDGVFGSQTEQAVKEFQKEKGNLTIDGIVGELTGRALDLIHYGVFVLHETWFKRYSSQAKELKEVDKTKWVKNDQEIICQLSSIKDYNESHWKVNVLADMFNFSEGYVYKPHVKIVKGYEDDLAESGDIENELGDQNKTDWNLVLKQCQTKGCSKATAKAENLFSGGVVDSENIVKADLKNLTESTKTDIKNVANKYNVPYSIIVALASRESHIGYILGMWGNDSGWGDNNHAFGILQVDKRYHVIKGKPDPFSYSHLDQAIGIFSKYRTELMMIHPDWSMPNILKGACVAYNSGVKNVRTIEGMNRGTTFNDYGDDVIARAQYVQKLI